MRFKDRHNIIRLSNIEHVNVECENKSKGSMGPPECRKIFYTFAWKGQHSLKPKILTKLFVETISIVDPNESFVETVAIC